MSTWQDLVTASLIGTERSSVPLVAVPGVPTPAGASAGGIIAVILANIVAVFLVRIIGKNLEG